MAEIVPAILEKNLNEIKKKLSSLRGRTRTVQLDFCDGAYVQNVTWPFSFGGFSDYDFAKIMQEEEGLPFWDEFDFELDLMVRDAILNFDLWLKLGPRRIVFHLERGQNAVLEFEHFFEGIDLYVRDNVEIGLAFSPEDNMETVVRLGNKVDFLQCMGIREIGFQGQKFDEKVFEAVKYLKEQIPGLVLSVDGGINLENGEQLLKLGVDRLVVGSSIWKSSDILGSLESFLDLV